MCCIRYLDASFVGSGFELSLWIRIRNKAEDQNFDRNGNMVYKKEEIPCPVEAKEKKFIAIFDQNI